MNVFKRKKSWKDASATLRKECTFKILIVGDYAVGKTAIIRRYTHNDFSKSYKVTIGVDFEKKTIIWNNHTKVNMQLWDIGGQKNFGSMTRVYYKCAAAAAVVFDITRMQTFKSAKRWLQDIVEKTTLEDGTKIPIILLANKADIDKSLIPTEEIIQLCDIFDIGAWYVTSAKENLNIDKPLHYLLEKLMVSYDHFAIEHLLQNSIKLSKESNASNSKCCGR